MAEEKQQDPNYPKVLYKGKIDLKAAENIGANKGEEHIVVQNAEEEKEARKDGFGDLHQPKGKKSEGEDK